MHIIIYLIAIKKERESIEGEYIEEENALFKKIIPLKGEGEEIKFNEEEIIEMKFKRPIITSGPSNCQYLDLNQCKEHIGDIEIDTMTPFTPPESLNLNPPHLSFDPKFYILEETKNSDPGTINSNTPLSPLDPSSPFHIKSLRNSLEKYITSKGRNIEMGELGKEKRCTVVLDLDETLLKTLSCTAAVRAAMIWRKESITVSPQGIYFLKRPYLSEFLTKLDLIAEIIIFTSSDTNYANELCTVIQKQVDVQFAAILTRQNCHVCGQQGVIKDLKVIKGRKKRKTIIVDDLSNVWPFHAQSLIQIPKYHGSANDKELIKIFLRIQLFIDQLKATKT